MSEPDLSKTPVQLYKLRSGETVLGFFLGQHETRTGYVHELWKPQVPRDQWDDPWEDWVPFLKSNQIPIKLEEVVLLAEEAEIEDWMVEQFRQEFEPTVE